MQSSPSGDARVAVPGPPLSGMCFVSRRRRPMAATVTITCTLTVKPSHLTQKKMALDYIYCGLLLSVVLSPTTMQYATKNRVRSTANICSSLLFSSPFFPSRSLLLLFSRSCSCSPLAIVLAPLSLLLSSRLLSSPLVSSCLLSSPLVSPRSCSCSPTHIGL
jgi:hypothetical protein